MKRFKLIFALHKYYFEKGLQILSYAKVLILAFGFASASVFWTLIVGFSYAILCYFIGLIWTKQGMAHAENEINNRFNPFVKTMLKRKV